MSEWSCPICSRHGWFVRISDTSVYIGPGLGILVCKRCEKSRKDEIDRRNAVFHTPSGSKKDPTCAHSWKHPHEGRWYCSKCFATYNWMCGCGGSGFVCGPHYQEFVNEKLDMDRFLAKEAW